MWETDTPSTYDEGGAAEALLSGESLCMEDLEQQIEEIFEVAHAQVVHQACPFGSSEIISPATRDYVSEDEESDSTSVSSDKKAHQHHFPGFKDYQRVQLLPISEPLIVLVQSQTQLQSAVFPVFEPLIVPSIRQTPDTPPEFPSAEEEEEEESKNTLDGKLTEDDFNFFQEEVTVKSLTSCKTNALLKAFEVNKRLTNLANAGGPEKEEFQALANSVDEFTSALMDPLKADDDTRETFGPCLDYVVDKAIDAEQKKFISHPVVYNLLQWRWYGSYLSMEKSPWTKAGWWAFCFLNLWTLIDMIMFPILFALFFIVHVLQERARKREATDICFVVSLSKDGTDEAFTLIKNTISYVIHKYGCHAAKYCVIQRRDENLANSINFNVGFVDETSLLQEVESMEKAQRTHPQLHEDICQARDSFKNSSVRQGAKKIVFVFVNNNIDAIARRKGDLKAVIEETKKLGIHLLPVGIGEHARLEELTEIASDNITPLHFGRYESARTLGKAILQGVEGKDIYEHYLDYFTTPYFIFVRDTLSNLALLGLHFAICLSPSTVAFSGLEWAIFVFFLGRIVMELDQFLHAKMAEKKAIKQKSIRGSNHRNCSPSEQNETQPEGNVVLRKFSKYFSDRWNRLDFIILVIYIITFTLRMITWGTSTVVYDNRPLAVACYLYGLIAMFLTLRVFGHVMEGVRGIGAIQIALFFIMRDVAAIFWQFLATILAFSLVMTKIFVAEKSHLSNRNATDELACNKGGFYCWWSVAKHLAWSLLGIADLDPLNSIDGPSVTLVRFLYSLFLIMGVILLLNMMIALLSNTYQQVEDNSLREWSFKKAITVKTYSVYHPTPVPFNLISIPVVALYQLCQRCVCKGRPINKAGLDEREMKTALDRLVVKLQREYFATYGYSFPLTDESKMDQLLHETDGNRQMANQIVQRVFRQRGCRQEKFKTGACAWESKGIEIEGCLLTYQGPDFCDVCETFPRKKYHGARHLAPFTRDMPRIEVLIQESGERRILAVGVVYDTYDFHLMPGWRGGTVGYHVDDGRIFEEGCAKFGREVDGKCKKMARNDIDVCLQGLKQSNKRTANDDKRLRPRDLIYPKQFGEDIAIDPSVNLKTLFPVEAKNEPANDRFNLRTEDLLADIFPQEILGRDIFVLIDNELQQKNTNAMAYRGDLVACQVDFNDVSYGRISITFFLNGREVACATMQYTAGHTTLFPFVAMGYEEIQVLAKMCPRDSSLSQTSYEIPSDVQTLDSDLAAMKYMCRLTREDCEAVKLQMEEIETRRREDTLALEDKITELKRLLVDLSQDLKKDKSD